MTQDEITREQALLVVLDGSKDSGTWSEEVRLAISKLLPELKLAGRWVFIGSNFWERRAVTGELLVRMRRDRVGGRWCFKGEAGIAETKWIDDPAIIVEWCHQQVRGRGYVGEPGPLPFAGHKADEVDTPAEYGGEGGAP